MSFDDEVIIIILGREVVWMKYIHMPKILKIDFDKPVPFRQQVAVMFTVLIISCLLFTVVYFQQILSGNIETKAKSEVDHEVSGATASQESSVVSESSLVSSETQESNTSYQQSSNSTEISNSDDGKLAVKELGKMTSVSKSYDDIHYGELILVNKDYSCRTDGENVESIFDLKSDSYVVTDKYVSMNISIVEYVNSMLDDFYSLYGESDIMIACGYRSYDTQVGLFNNEIDEVGFDEAEQWVARPGYSEHQTGYVFDLNLNVEGGNGIDYSGEGNYAWINEHCSDYGFIIRYPAGKEEITGYSAEPWHFRYVGIPHSQYISDNGITLEEYLDLIYKHKSDNPMVINDHDDCRWCVYFVEADESGNTNIPVPENYDYLISGDNCSGFIVTVKLG